MSSNFRELFIWCDRVVQGSSRSLYLRDVFGWHLSIDKKRIKSHLLFIPNVGIGEHVKCRLPCAEEQTGSISRLCTTSLRVVLKLPNLLGLRWFCFYRRNKSVSKTKQTPWSYLRLYVQCNWFHLLNFSICSLPCWYLSPRNASNSWPYVSDLSEGELLSVGDVCYTHDTHVSLLQVGLGKLAILNKYLLKAKP